jgi:hypothetical protein
MVGVAVTGHFNVASERKSANSKFSFLSFSGKDNRAKTYGKPLHLYFISFCGDKVAEFVRNHQYAQYNYKN